jgi:hypothetical protein
MSIDLTLFTANSEASVNGQQGGPADHQAGLPPSELFVAGRKERTAERATWQVAAIACDAGATTAES